MLLMITLVSLVAAALLGALAWRLVQEDRRRTEARVAALIASLDADTPLEPAAASPPPAALDARLMDLGDPDTPTGPVRAVAPSLGSTRGDLFSDATRDETPAGSRLVAVGVVAAVLVGAIALSWLTARALAPAAVSTSRPSAAAAAAAAPPLELLSLTSTRRGPDLSISGLVRNPRSGEPVARIAAVVFFFDDRGGFLRSARAPLEIRSLAPGDQSPFLVTIAAPDGISRYRVSFRAGEGAVVPHVDRRPTGSDGHGAPDAPATRRAGL